MKIWVDADACPVVDIIVSMAAQYAIPCILLCDTSHAIYREGCETLILDKGPDSVDFAIANRATSGDLVITQDYGLASMCLAKKARVLHQDGWEYTSGNIPYLMEQRHAARKFRAAGGHTKGPVKRTQKQNTTFASALEQVLQNSTQG